LSSEEAEDEFQVDPQSDIEADSFSDSGYDEESLRGSVESLASSTYEYHYEHGHRYHRSGQTLFPNDESEQDRLDLQHHIFRLILDGRITHSPLPAPGSKILDVGTGTGIWAIDMGDYIPSATIIGVDQSPIQPTWVPPNVTFEIDDINKPWLQEDNSFDFIHIRTMAGCVTDWAALFAEVFRVLKPGGRVESSEFALMWECTDGSFNPNNNCGTWTRNFHRIASEALHIDFNPIPKIPSWMREAGFTNVEKVDKLVPVGPWPKDPRLKNIGRYFLSNMLESGVENYTMALFTKAGWDATSVHAMVGGVRKELLDSRIHAFTRAWFITAEKPVAS
ncbi:hypothetical protein DH86_00003415, partial [Scytalidium sp. 3C]